MGLVVGIDMATAEVRGIAADAGGRECAAARCRLPDPVSPRPGWYEQDATAWWPTVVAVLSRLADQLGADRDSVVALSVCSTSGTVVALDRDLAPIGPALMYSDQRAVPQAEAAQRAATGRWASLGLRIQPSFGLPKWAWLLSQTSQPEIGASTARLAHASDAVVARLIGEAPPTDWSHALKSGYDPRRGEWAAEAMEALGIPDGLLPEVRRPTELAGRLHREAAEATGLPERCEVRLGMTDACAAQLAAGASAPGRFVSVLGSTLVLKGASHHIVADPAGAVYSHRHPGGWWLPGGASSTGARALAAFADRNRADPANPAGRDLADLDELAARHGPARGVVYPLVGRGERFPFVAGDAEGFTLGDLAGEVKRYRAVLEGVAFVERLGYERLAALGAAADPPIAACGGGSASRVWSRIRATVLGVPLIAMPSASTALGACILAAAGTLHPDLSAATEAMAVTGEQVDPERPEQGDQDALERNYQRFVAAITQRGWWPPGKPA